ncbi:formate-dependent phosphoribosylglycinamide formyltransferase [Beggiatoa leptomitoformis]|uniref:Formate-dependent phosphoribosylglycinamide formyltransferase n=1 Tax=Beggiatoa leptomitoformis TaxID=288004 RepID=A0A2N9YIS0_9GAMM|nr:formate-dependent phosphoribosylglycinamide formyltransferase [Beggiatoa leptomitoformis]ALG67366.1 formate-dependent phosphoribosylglycinamide formyltransferase [Beggiatoa leptomitoformis]AUI70428.1 formate-dependent phosphoribosylglycinamide formyltransferase [Beggiatoa leptomitoformis]
MKLGTPLTATALKVMLLGSGELGKEVIIALQRLGVEVIAVDRYPNAPGHQVAHRFHVIDMTNPHALHALVVLEKPDIIVPEIEAIATDMLLEIEQAGLAQVVPTARAAQITMNRERIRSLAADVLKIPTSRYAYANSEAELRSHIETIGFPCFVKPVMSSSGKGQSMLHNAEDIHSAWQHAMSAGRVSGGTVIVEEFIDFDFEITLLTVRALNSKGEIETYFCEPIGHIQKQGDYVESWQPQAMTPTALKIAQEMARKVTDNLGGRGIFGVELFVKGDQVWFSEVSPRPHDTGMVTMVTQMQNEFELHARALLGLPVSTALRNEGASAVIYGGYDSENGLIYEGIDEALQIPQTDLRLFGKPEAFIKRRMGVALAMGKTVEEAREHAKLAASKVRTVKP